MPEVTLPFPWSSCVQDFLQQCYERSGSHKSRSTYLSAISGFFTDPDKAPDLYTKNDVLRYLASPSKSNRNYGAVVSVSARNGRLTALSSFFRFASNYEVSKDVYLFVSRSPTAGIRRLKPEVTYRDIAADDFEKLLNVIPDTPIGWRDRALILLYFWLGRRRNELRELRYGDVQASIIIDENGTRRPGHTYKYHGKGGQRQEQLQEMPAPAWDALQTYLERSGRRATIAADDYLFVSIFPVQARHNHPLSGYRLCRIFQGYCALAGLSGAYSLHSLRHLAARERYSMGVDLRSIQAYLGHSNLATTDTYLRRLVGVSDPGSLLLEKRFARFSAF